MGPQFFWIPRGLVCLCYTTGQTLLYLLWRESLGHYQLMLPEDCYLCNFCHKSIRVKLQGTRGTLKL